MLHSTRSKKEYTASQAILKGLAEDGGLFVFDEIQKIDVKDILNLSYKELAFKILSSFLDDFTKEQILWAIENAYGENNFQKDVATVKAFENYAYLELFNGPTAAFKDVALTILPNFMTLAKKNLGVEGKTKIVVATSGDTGSATLSGFLGKADYSVSVLYPDNLVSPLQEKQMLLFSEGANKAYAYEGNFDDCQKIAKELALFDKGFSSANSINVGRLIPQIVYYFYGYVQLARCGKINVGDKINVAVPTGNFGNILAGYIAKQMGLPVNKLLCASNENNVLFDLINEGVYDRNRKFIKTYSPSMDILVSSNLERLLYYYYKDTEKIAALFSEFGKTGKIFLEEFKDIFRDFVSYYTLNGEIVKEISEEYSTKDYLIDPHTAVGLNCYHKYTAENNDGHYTMIVSTASPYKFMGAIKDSGIEIGYENAPVAIKKALNTEKKKTVLTKTSDIGQLDEILSGNKQN